MVLTCHMITRRDLQFAPRHVLLYQSYSCNSSWVWGMKGPPLDAFTELFEVQYFYSLRSVLSVQGSCQCRGTFLLFLYFSSFFFFKALLWFCILLGVQELEKANILVDLFVYCVSEAQGCTYVLTQLLWVERSWNILRQSKTPRLFF